MKQTSIEWLEQELKARYSLLNSDPLFEQAKEIYKQEIIDAYMERVDSTNKEDLRKIIGEQYYQETFKK
jgi:hypothetical protein